MRTNSIHPASRIIVRAILVCALFASLPLSQSRATVIVTISHSGVTALATGFNPNPSAHDPSNPKYYIPVYDNQMHEGNNSSDSVTASASGGKGSGSSSASINLPQYGGRASAQASGSGGGLRKIDLTNWRKCS